MLLDRPTSRSTCFARNIRQYNTALPFFAVLSQLFCFCFIQCQIHHIHVLAECCLPALSRSPCFFLELRWCPFKFLESNIPAPSVCTFQNRRLFLTSNSRCCLRWNDISISVDSFQWKLLDLWLSRQGRHDELIRNDWDYIPKPGPGSRAWIIILVN